MTARIPASQRPHRSNDARMLTQLLDHRGDVESPLRPHLKLAIKPDTRLCVWSAELFFNVEPPQLELAAMEIEFYIAEELQARASAASCLHRVNPGEGFKLFRVESSSPDAPIDVYVTQQNDRHPWRLVLYLIECPLR